ncbi:50S ribosomal protein L5 [Candidatus Nanohalococcus occultus]|uniref:Ribosomal protein L5 n=1 Tax=Candidatus Nanohalococcus occultus TaxID=2978047 RepID=A0ABY8CF96_9ARCH|nr:Ribosomal protein L5 [Candidatus Nanohaloarchaeota archaeon SVXNc]
MNEMKQIEVSKVVVNIGEGQVGQGVENAVSLLKKLTGKEPVRTESKDESKSFGLREGLNIGAMVTLRGEEAREFLEKVAPAANEITDGSFDGNGNFGFGVSEYIDVPGVDYDSDIGMKGFEVAVSLERPGYRVKRRNHKPSKIGKQHKVSDQEAKEFVKTELTLEVTE